MQKSLDTANILGIRTVSSGMNEVLERIVQVWKGKAYTKPFFVVTANPEIVVAAQEDKEFKQVINKADMVVADAVGVVWASEGKIKNRVAGRVLVEKMLDKKPRVFFLGGQNGVARVLAMKYKGESDEGEPNIKSQLLNQNPKIINKINKYKPDLLLVAYGAPWQEKWIARNLDKLRVKVVMGVGGTFDVLSGRKPKPPQLMEKLGLEWLWRLMLEPGRWKRQLKLVKFVWLVLKARGRE